MSQMFHRYRYDPVRAARSTLGELAWLIHLEEAGEIPRREIQESTRAKWSLVESWGVRLTEGNSLPETSNGTMCIEFAKHMAPIFEHLPPLEWRSWAEGLARAALGSASEPDPVTRRELRRILAFVLRRGGEYDEALRLVLLNLERDRLEQRERPEEYGESIHDAIELYDALSMPDSIDPLCREWLKFQRRSGYGGEMGRADAVFSYACHLLNTGRDSRGRVMLLCAESKYLSALQAHGDWSSRAARNLAAVYQMDERLDDATAVYDRLREAHRSRGRLGGDEYAALLKKMMVVYMTQGCWDKALDAIREFLDARQGATGEMDSTYAGGMNDLGAVYSGLGQYREATAAYREALSIYEVVVGQHDPVYIDCIINLAGCHEEAGDMGEAEQALRNAIDLLEKAYGEDDLEVAAGLSELGFCLRASERDMEARPLFERALAIRRSKTGAYGYETAEAAFALASLLADQGFRCEAAKLLSEASEAYKATVGPSSEEFIECIERLCELDEDRT
jgi:tetratricopeptide (TPR) repeat protein